MESLTLIPGRNQSKETEERERSKLYAHTDGGLVMMMKQTARSSGDSICDERPYDRNTDDRIREWDAADSYFMHPPSACARLS